MSTNLWKCANCYFCSTNAILHYKCYFALQMLFFAVEIIFFGVDYKFFAVQEKIFQHALQTFAASLPPYVASFASFWQDFSSVLRPCVKFLKRSTKVCCIFLGGVKAFLWTACCCQRACLNEWVLRVLRGAVLETPQISVELGTLKCSPCNDRYTFLACSLEIQVESFWAVHTMYSHQLRPCIPNF